MRPPQGSHLWTVFAILAMMAAVTWLCSTPVGLAFAK